MSKQIDQLHKVEYENRVRHTFQRRGNKLLKTTSTRDPKGKSEVKIFVAGQGEAVERPSRHQPIPFMNAGRTRVTLPLKAYFAGDPLDWEDNESFELDDLQTIADQSAMALGRKVDDVIITELNGTTVKVGDGTEPFSLKMHLQITEQASNLNWDEEEGSIFHLVCPNAWAHMMTYKQFTSSDYISDENLPFLNRMNSRNFDGVYYIKHKGLKSPAPGEMRSLCYFGPAIAAAGEAVGAAPEWRGGREQQWVVMDKVRTGCKRHEADAVIAGHYKIADVRNALHPDPEA